MYLKTTICDSYLKAVLSKKSPSKLIKLFTLCNFIQKSETCKGNGNCFVMYYFKDMLLTDKSLKIHEVWIADMNQQQKIRMRQCRSQLLSQN